MEWPHGHRINGLFGHRKFDESQAWGNQSIPTLGNNPEPEERFLAKESFSRHLRSPPERLRNQ